MPSLVSCHWNAVAYVGRLGQNAAKYGGAPILSRREKLIYGNKTVGAGDCRL